MEDRFDAIEAKLHGITNRLDNMFGSVSGDMRTMNSDSDSSMLDGPCFTEHLNKMDDVNTRLSRIELLLFRTPINDFLKIDEELKHLLPQTMRCASASASKFDH